MTDASVMRSVDFHGDTLAGIVGDSDETALVSIRHLCDGIGVDFSSQLQRLRKKSWATVVMITTVGADAKDREMACFPLRQVPMLLASISETKVRPELRDKLVRYQREACEVLARHFVDRKTEAMSTIATNEQIIVFARELGDQIVRPIMQELHGIGARVGDVETDVAGIKSEVVGLKGAVDAYLRHKRKRPSPSVYQQHVEFARHEMPVCPWCRRSPLFDDGGEFVGQVHHHAAASDAVPEALMVICGACNMRCNREPMPRSVVDYYLLAFKTWTGPLFARRVS